MATIVNNSTPESQSSNSLGWLLGVVLLIVMFFALLYYGLPALRGGFGLGKTEVNIPSQFDVNVKQQQPAPQGQ